jgi:hypothetical protein
VKVILIGDSPGKEIPIVVAARLRDMIGDDALKAAVYHTIGPTRKTKTVPVSYGVVNSWGIRCKLGFLNQHNIVLLGREVSRCWGIHRRVRYLESRYAICGKCLVLPSMPHQFWRSENSVKAATEALRRFIGQH